MPPNDDQLKRLEQFLGRALQPDARPALRKPRRGPGRPIAAPPTPAGARRITLEEAVPGGYAVRVAERGSLYKVITPVGKELLTPERFSAAFAGAETPFQQRLWQSCRMTATLEDLLFVDLETTGLAQAPLFLIGAMSWEQDGLLIRQFLARNADEEAAVIQAFVDLAAAKALLITFNGKSFDLPTLYQRATANGLLCVLHARHFDLLHECRQAWRAGLPNCQLQTLEEHICGHPPREQDIPGEHIPAAYQAFLRNGNALQLAQIMRHNVRDLLTMAELLGRLPSLSDG